jgi:PPP family 3-phenylpropionic acid transporter
MAYIEKDLDKMKKQYSNYIGIYLFSYFCIGALFPLLPQYLQTIGFDGIQIGTITASSMAVGIVAAPFWAMIYEKRNSNRQLLYILYGLALVLVFLLSFIKSYALFLVIYVIAFSFESPIRPLNDTMTLNSGHMFGKVRQWGSAGFALGVFLAGIIAENLGLISIFAMYSISMLIGLLFLISLKSSSMEQYADDNEKITSGNFKTLLHNKKYIALVLVAFFMNGTAIAHNTYFGFLFMESGGTIAGIGIAFLLMVGSEMPMMGLAETIEKKMPMERLLLIAMILSTVRFLWYSTTPAPALLIGTFFLQGIVNGLFLVKIVTYISRTVDKGIMGSAITLYTAISSNTSAILCLFVGGVLLEKFSGASVYLFYGLFNLVGVILYIGFGLYKRSNQSNWR